MNPILAITGEMWTESGIQKWYVITINFLRWENGMVI